jgi:hypothetical protein
MMFSFILAMLLLVAGIAAVRAETIIVPGHNIDVYLDIDHCAQAGMVLCGGSGSTGAAAVGNDSIIAVMVHVTKDNGLPAGGLTESAFALTAIMNPAPGVSPVFVPTSACAACFAEQTAGVYRLAIRPAAGTWGDGTYMAVLEVTGGGGTTRQTVVPIDIPN